jgi:hypothetical protein
MNTSNRYGVETAARQHQAEIGEHLRHRAQLRDQAPQVAPADRLGRRWRSRLMPLTLGVIITLGVAALIL